MKLFSVAVTMTALVTIVVPSTLARDLTFEERVQAQEAVERVYYSHLISATRGFEEVVPHAVVEAKVRTYLKPNGTNGL
jgi:hypothetical protein